jgi:alkylation response protein AidB-like acyl-CoA dehydrogenase
MNFNLQEEQDMLKKTARDFLINRCPKTLVREMEEDEKGYPTELWQEIADLGWTGLAFPEKYGGGGMSFLDLVLLIEEMARACLPSPFFTTVILSGLAILDAGTEEQKQAYLTQVSSGKSIFTLALCEGETQHEVSSIATTATANNDHFIISGTKLFVPNAHVADHILYVTRTNKQTGDGVTVFIVDAKSPGISNTVLDTIARDKLCEVIFDKVHVSKDNILGQRGIDLKAMQGIIERAVVAKCCEIVGYSQQMLEMTIDYAKERKQFDRPIGSFQIIQHYCSNILTDVEGLRLSAYQAAWRLSEGLPATKEVAVAKAWASEAGERIISLGHQIFGAMGVTNDHDLHLYTRRIKAAQLTFGDADFYHEVLAQDMGL